MLVSRGRLNLEMTLGRWLDIAADSRSVRVLPITPGVAIELSRIPDTIHRDPADRLIISTSRAHGLPLLTRDEAIVRSGLVKLWKPRAPAAVDHRLRLPRLFALKDSIDNPSNPDAYFQDFDTKLANRHIFDQYEKLEKYLAALDGRSWDGFHARATGKLVARQRDKGRGWQDLFDVLNEAVAYAYLAARGAQEIRFLPTARNTKTPDLAASLTGRTMLCEVKTINVSAKQADHQARVARGEIFGSKVNSELPENWLQKFQAKIEDALEQLKSHDQRESTFVIFIAINFDDRIGDYHDRHFMQLDDFLDGIDLGGAELVLYPTSNVFERTYVMRNATVFLG